jgi:hypothetical protein
VQRDVSRQLPLLSEINLLFENWPSFSGSGLACLDIKESKMEKEM